MVVQQAGGEKAGSGKEGRGDNDEGGLLAGMILEIADPLLEVRIGFTEKDFRLSGLSFFVGKEGRVVGERIGFAGFEPVEHFGADDAEEKDKHGDDAETLNPILVGLSWIGCLAAGGH